MPEGKRTPDMDEQDNTAPEAEATDAEVEAVEEEAVAELAAAAATDDPVQRLEAEVAALKDQLLRALAETENLRRRSQRERADTIKYAAAPLIKDVVGVADNLRRAMENIPADAIEADEHLKTLLTGLQLTEKELETVFERHHIVKIDPLGEPMDPHFHEAMFEIPDPNAASGTVLQVLQVGYRLHDRLLRPAQVGVAKGGPSAGSNNGDGDVPPGSTVDTTA